MTLQEYMVLKEECDKARDEFIAATDPEDKIAKCKAWRKLSEELTKDVDDDDNKAKQSGDTKALWAAIIAGVVSLAKTGGDIYLTLRGYKEAQDVLNKRMWFAQTGILPKDVDADVPRFLSEINRISRR